MKDVGTGRKAKKTAARHSFAREVSGALFPVHVAWYSCVDHAA